MPVVISMPRQLLFVDFDSSFEPGGPESARIRVTDKKQENRTKKKRRKIDKAKCMLVKRARYADELLF